MQKMHTTTTQNFQKGMEKVMGKTDRSPRKGNNVMRDPGFSRINLTDIKEKIRRFRIPNISVKTTAVATTAVILSASVITGAVVWGVKTPARAADIYIGSDTVTEAPVLFGVGRFSVIEDEEYDSYEDYEDTQTSEVTDAPETTTPETDIPETDTSAEETPEINTGRVDDGRYIVTFTFHSRDSISCSAETPATVGELAERLGITFSEKDVLNIPVDTVISEDTVISTDKITHSTVTVTESISYDTKYVDDPSIYKGNQKIVQYGQTGQSVTEYSVKYVNGIEESRTELRTYVSKKPVTQIVHRGTAVYKAPATHSRPSSSVTINRSEGTITGSDGKTYRYSGYLDVNAVWYSSGGFCANGMPADERVIAVDPSVIPLGTKVYITGDYADIGVRTAADTGGNVRGNMIDICFNPSNPLAQGFGSRPMRVYFIEE